MSTHVTGVAFLGADGSFTQEAAERWCEGLDGARELVGASSSEGVLELLASGRVERAVLPVANSTGGLVWPTLRALTGRALELVDEVVLAVRFDLFVARPGLAAGDVRRVVSHPQAFRQCALALERLLPGCAHEHASDTATAARGLADGTLGDHTAVLAGPRAGARYELTVLAREMQDRPDNRTFFAVLARADAPGIRVRGED